VILRTLGATAVVAFCAGVASGSLDDTLRSVAASYYANAAKIEILTGRDSTMDYYQRLLDDADLAHLPAPNNYSTQTWRRLIQAEAQLDLSLATQLLHDSFVPLASVHGLAEHSFVLRKTERCSRSHSTCPALTRRKSPRRWWFSCMDGFNPNRI
jgi:hypothetical protein